MHHHVFADWRRARVTFPRLRVPLFTVSVFVVMLSGSDESRADVMAPNCYAGGSQIFEFYLPNQSCFAWWQAQDNGTSATKIHFFSSNIQVATVGGTPPGLPAGYAGPYPPASAYIATIISGINPGTATISVLADQSDGRVFNYTSMTVKNLYSLPQNATEEEAVRRSVEIARSSLRQQLGREPTEIELAREAYRDAITFYREKGGAETSQLTALRDAEYFLRGLSGGQLLRADPSQIELTDLKNEIGNMTSPVSTRVRNKIKEWFPGKLDEGFPGAAPGGDEEATAGWRAGVTGKTVDDAINEHFRHSEPTPPPTPTGNPVNPIKPDGSIDLHPLGYDVKFNAFDVAVAPGATYFFDPASANDYVISTLGLDLMSLLIPDQFGNHRPFEITMGNLKLPWHEGEVLNFSDLNLLEWPTDIFLSQVAPRDEEFVIGLGFRTAGTGEVLIAEHKTEVPEPSSLAVIAAGILTAWRLRKRQRRSV